MKARLLAIGWVCLAFAACSKSTEALPPSVSRNPAPHFSFTELSGRKMSSREFEGKWVVLNIWATWCPPCVREIPDFIALQKELEPKGVQLVGISVDDQGMEAVKPFARRMSINYPILLSKVSTVHNVFGPINAIPTTFIIDPEWHVVDQFTGMVDGKVLETVIKDFISGKRQPKM